MGPTDTNNARPARPLSDREQAVLRSVVESFVQTADPVGSRFISRRFMPDLSPASIRNTMSDLEEMGYLDHPYTSAGRIPTELGYRTYVDELMGLSRLSPRVRSMLSSEMLARGIDMYDMLHKSSRLLGKVSNLLGVALSPKLSTGILDRLEVVPLSSTRVMFVISVRSGLVKTIILEIDSDLRREELDAVVSVLNERLSGLTLEEIRRSFANRVKDLTDDRSDFVKLVLRKAPVIFSDLPEGRRFSYGGAHNIFSQPEFREPAEMRNVIELLESEDIVVHLLESRAEPGGELGRASVTIGRENRDEKAARYSIVKAQYRLGEVIGTVGVIGPTRMEYGKIMALVESMAQLLSKSAQPAEKN